MAKKYMVVEKNGFPGYDNYDIAKIYALENSARMGRTYFIVSVVAEASPNPGTSVLTEVTDVA